jgi:hypothetical protein
MTSSDPLFLARVLALPLTVRPCGWHVRIGARVLCLGDDVPRAYALLATHAPTQGRAGRVGVVMGVG